MKFTRKKLLLLIPVLLLIGGGVYYFVIRDDSKPPVVQEFTSADDIQPTQNNQTTDQPEESQEQSGEQLPTKPELEEPATTGTASVTLSFAEQQDSNIVARAFAESDKSGTCELKLTNGDQQVTKTSGSTLQTSYYQCDGFEFSVNDMPSAGMWTAIVTFIDSGGARSESNSFEFEVTK